MGRSALIVDDEPLVRKLTARALENGGFDCQQAECGKDAMKLLAHQHFDLMITDLKMPNGNGHSLCLEALQTPHPPLIAVLSGVAESKIEQDLRKRGISHIYSKPINYMELAQTLNDAVCAQSPTSPFQHTPAQDQSPARPKTWEVQHASVANPMTAKTVVILLRDEKQSRDLACGLPANSVYSIIARNTDQLRQVLDSRRVDLLVIEDELDGFLTGREVLDKLRKELIGPEVLLLTANKDLCTQPAEKVGVREILSSEQSHAQISDAIQKHLIVQQIVGMDISQKAKSLVADYDYIPPLPQMLVKIMQYLQQSVDEISISDLARDIESDVTMATELLKVANSSSMGIHARVNSVKDAVKLLGPRRSIVVCLSLASRTINSTMLSHWTDSFRSWYYRRVALNSHIAEAIAEDVEKVSPEMGYLLGMLQDLGILVLAAHFGERYFQFVIKRTMEIGPLHLASVEEDAVAIGHAEVSAAILQSWDFPGSLIWPVANHHDALLRGNTDGKYDPYLRCMRIAEAFSDLSEGNHPVRRRRLNALLEHYTPAQQTQISKSLLRAVTAAKESNQILSLPIPDHEELEKLVRHVIEGSSQENSDRAQTEADNWD